MPRDLVRGVVARIVYYQDGTSQMDIILSDGAGGVIQDGRPFYNFVPRKCLGRFVELEEVESDGAISQTLIGENFSMAGKITREQRLELRKSGRVARSEFSLE